MSSKISDQLQYFHYFVKILGVHFSAGDAVYPVVLVLGTSKTSFFPNHEDASQSNSPSRVKVRELVVLTAV